MIQKFINDPHSADRVDEQDERVTGAKQGPNTTETTSACPMEEAEQSGSQPGSYFGSGWMKSLVETVQKLGSIEDTTRGEENYTKELRIDPAGRYTVLDQVNSL